MKTCYSRTAVLSFCLVGLSSRVEAQSTIDATNKYAYGANTGWINFLPSPTQGVVVGEAYLSGFAYGANFGWMNFGDGSPGNGHTYGNASDTDFGVNHNGAGQLSGRAYGANIGWINFGWAGANDPNRPQVDLLTGAFSGYAYSANTGWINLGTGNLSTDSLACPDTDSDGMGDAWERQRFGNLSLAGIGTDKDGDGQSDAAEYLADTNPNSAAEKLKIVSQAYSVNSLNVTLEFTTTRPTRVYRIETSTTLLGTGPGAWSATGSLFTADPGSTTMKTVSFAASPLRFFRVVAEKPLP